MFVSPESSPGRNFYPRPPRGGRRIAMSDLNLRIAISIHALREEGDPLPCCRGFMLPDFYPRPPRGGRRARWNPLVLIPVFLSTPSARRATAIDVSGQIGRQISIHALREEGDLSASYYYTFSKISIHALREEGDQEQLLAEINRRRFLSTPSARRATCSPLCRLCTPRHFYPRPPRGGRRVPRTRRPQPVHFYPRPPRGGRRVFLDEDQSDILISIHALREEGDRVRFLRSSQRHNFYPRPPRGGRPSGGFAMGYVTKFLSTPSARRATQSGKTCTCVPSNFYPRPPRGGRHAHISIPAPFAQFLSTPSARRATYKRTELEPSMDISIHALREEGDSRRKRSKSNLKYFYPRPPRGGRRWMAVWLQSG